jgi:hypothetical protein
MLMPIEITIHISWNARNSLLSILQYNNWLNMIIKVNYFRFCSIKGHEGWSVLK